jgi:hypothetical protein
MKNLDEPARARVMARESARDHALGYEKDGNALRPWIVYSDCRKTGVPVPE